MVKIGIPSSLFYYVYYPAWETFFSTLGAKVVASGKTTKKILDEGVREALADACVPVKVFFGHALALKNRADFLFIPRIVCLNKKTVYCPKFLGLPDMIRHGLPDMPPIIDVRVDTRTERRALWKAFQQAGKLLGAGKFHLLQAFNRAQRVQKLYDQMLLSGLQPEEAMQQLKGKHNFTKKNKGQLNIAVLGYPYILYDPFINVQLMEKLSDLGVNVLTPENVSPKILDKQKVNIKKKPLLDFLRESYAGGSILFWYRAPGRSHSCDCFWLWPGFHFKQLPCS